MAYKPKLPFTQATTNGIVNNHRYDFNHKNFSSYMKSKGGYRKYVESLGGTFKKHAGHNAANKVDYTVKTEKEFQECADYVFGLMTIWGVNYTDRNGKKVWGSNDGKYADDAFYDSSVNLGQFFTDQGNRNGFKVSIDQILSGSTKGGMMVNCGFAATYIFKKAGLIPAGGENLEVEFYGDKSYHKYYRNRGARKITNLKDSSTFQVGDVIGYHKSGSGFTYSHCATVVAVDKSVGTYTLFDGGSKRFTKTRGCNVVGKIGDDPCYGSYTRFEVLRLPLNLKQEAKQEVSTVLTMDQFYKKYNGKAIDHDGAYGVQCVDGFRLLCMELGIPVKPTPNNWADGYWLSRNALGYNKYFNYITDYKQLKNGDVVIWKQKSRSHPSSHIAIYYNGKEFGQNQGGNRGFCLKATDFSDMLGALRPKVWASSSGSSTPAAKPVEKVATGKAKSFNSKLAGTYKVTAKAGLWLRNAAGTNQAKMALMPLNTKVNCYGYYSAVSGVNWYYVITTVGGVKYTGFCCAKSYLKKV